MKLVMATLIRDEEDVLEHNLRYHRAQGVDHFIVTDNGSTDRTPEILGRYEAAGLLTLIREPATDDYRSQARLWLTRMARVASTELGADWVVHVDADEFWLPATGTLKQALESIPDSYGVVVAPWSEYVARPDGPGAFWERMTVRRARSDLIPKIAHRADPDAVVGHGCHEVDVRRDGRVRRGSARAVNRAGPADSRAAAGRPATEDRLVWAPEWPARVLHFPLRSFDQYRRKVQVTLGGYRQHAYDDLRRAYEGGRLPELYAKLVYDDAAVEGGLRGGNLVEDVRLRDLLPRVPDPLDPDAPPVELQPTPPEEAERELAELRLDAMQTLTHTQRWLSSRLEDARRRRRLKRLRAWIRRAERGLATTWPRR